MKHIGRILFATLLLLTWGMYTLVAYDFLLQSFFTHTRLAVSLSIFFGGVFGLGVSLIVWVFDPLNLCSD